MLPDKNNWTYPSSPWALMVRLARVKKWGRGVFRGGGKNMVSKTSTTVTTTTTAAAATTTTRTTTTTTKPQ